MVYLLIGVSLLIDLIFLASQLRPLVSRRDRRLVTPRRGSRLRLIAPYRDWGARFTARIGIRHICRCLLTVRLNPFNPKIFHLHQSPWSDIRHKKDVRNPVPVTVSAINLAPVIFGINFSSSIFWCNLQYDIGFILPISNITCKYQLDIK